MICAPETGREHELKCWPAPFGAIARGEKAWEFRLDDRGYKVGDVLVLREFLPHLGAYTGGVIRAKVTYILHAGFGMPNGYVIMSIEICGPRALPIAVSLAAIGSFLVGLALGACL